MSLNDRQHVEAVAIMQRLLDVASHFGADEEGQRAATQWLGENHPEPSVYMAAMRAMVGVPNTEQER